MRMLESTRNIISGLFFTVGFLALIADFYNSLYKIDSSTSKLYQHPFIVSKNIQAIEKHVMSAQILLHRYIESYQYNQVISNSRLKRQLESHYARIEESFEQVDAFYLGDKKDVDKNLTIFREAQQLHQAFILLVEQAKYDDAFNVLDNDIDALTNRQVDELLQLHLFAQNKAIEFKNLAHQEFLSTMPIFLIFLLYFSFIIFYYYKANTRSLKRAVTEITKESKWRKEILNATPDAMIICDDNGQIIDANEQASILLGYTSKQLKVMSVEELVPIHLKDKHLAHRKKHAVTPYKRPMNKTSGLKVQLKSGQELDVGINLSTTSVNDKLVHIAAIRDISTELEIRKKIEYQTNFDAITDLPNRNLCEDRFNQLVAKKHSDDIEVSLLFIDIDDFKKVNDTLGHDIGDKLLKSISDRVNSNLPSSATFGRLGGDEFLIIMDNKGHLDKVQSCALEILNSFKRPFQIDSNTIKVSCSVGVAIYPADGRNYTELLRKADAAMYHAKSLGKNQFAYYFDSLTLGLSKYFEIEEAFLNTNIEQEFYMVYQPQIDLETNKIMGAEALIRWQNDHLPNVSPQDFIPVAENNGKIVELGEFIIREALNFVVMAINLTKNKSFKISINISPKQLTDEKLLNYLLEQLEDRGLTTQNLALEITEGVLLDNSPATAELLNKIADTNIILSMDDFGTGYSSLSYLRQFPFKHVKLDKSFIDEILKSENSKALVRSSIMMAHALGLKVVAEGIESHEQARCLQSFNCDFAQGYFYSEPITKQKFKDLVKMSVEVPKLHMKTKF